MTNRCTICVYSIVRLTWLPKHEVIDAIVTPLEASFNVLVVKTNPICVVSVVVVNVIGQEQSLILGMN